MTDQERFVAELDRDKRRWKVRRRIAVVSFFFLLIVSAFFISAPFFMTAVQIASASEFNGIIITMIGFFSTIVMTYIGVATYSDVASKSNKTVGKKDL